MKKTAKKQLKKHVFSYLRFLHVCKFYETDHTAGYSIR
jgi:hypothetical protein